MKSRHNKPEIASQAPRGERANGKARLKVCPTRVAELLKWANLAGDEVLPARLPLPQVEAQKGYGLADLMAALSQLPDALRLHLLELMNRPSEWAEQPAAARREFKKRFPDPKEADLVSKKMDFRFAAQFAAVYRRYKTILAARETLSAIVDEKRPVWPTTAFMTRGEDGKGKYAGDPIGDALLEAEIDYIKRCPVCRIFFYAGRDNIEAYPASCADALRKRLKRARRVTNLKVERKARKK